MVSALCSCLKPQLFAGRKRSAPTLDRLLLAAHTGRQFFFADGPASMDRSLAVPPSGPAYVVEQLATSAREA
jgi:hypothetical protein